MNAVSLQSRPTHAVHFSPRLQHAVRLLQMSTADYAQALRDAALENPFLEVDAPEPSLAIDEGSPARDDRGAAFDRAQVLDRMAGAEPASRRHLSHDDSWDLLARTPVRTSLAAHLRAQLGTPPLARRERLLAELVIEALDDDGYLRLSREDLADSLGDDPARRALDELRAALHRVQSLDPAGVAARGVAECLALQLREVADPDLRELATRIVSNHLDLLATRSTARLAAQLGASERATCAAVDRILKLDPRPGARYDDTQAQAVVPDVTVRKVDGVWRTVQNDAALPRIRLHQSYARLFERHRARGDVALKDCLDRARWTVQNAAQRVSTILDVATAIVERQTLFLDHGPLAMKPLGLREIADALGVHPSTVSRAVHDKYLATPHGVFELHHFFSRGMAHTGGGASAPVALQALIRELIDAERPHTPLSDAALARELTQQGFLIARRTVTKYRQGLNIEAVERRRHA
jgi:RNA polymerase sigma-54 factor